MSTSESAEHRIVVGVDGSDSSLHALDWAVHQAELTGASLLVMAAWHWPPNWGWGMPIVPPTTPQEDTEEVLTKVLEPLRRAHPAVSIESRVVESHPAPALVKASKDAELLVVGSRGHGEFAGMLLGSVGEHCASNAECPVLVFHEKGEKRK